MIELCLAESKRFFEKLSRFLKLSEVLLIECIVLHVVSLPLILPLRYFRGGLMGLKTSTGPGTTIRLDLGMWLVNIGLVSS